jgi:hypothetical protein
MSIVVAGAGTAGWMAALFANTVYPDSEVTVVYDDKTPIIGVGESTTPHFIQFMERVGVDVSDLVKNCDSTLKNSIKFTNWKGDDTSYHHAFTWGPNELQEYFNGLSLGINLDKVDIGCMLSENNKVPFTNHPRNSDGVPGDSYAACNYALHFNAKKMAEYLQTVGVSRGIKTIVGKIEDVSLDPDGYVTELILDTKQKIKTDFIFDCTGFARFFVNKIYKSPVKSYEKELPVKRAMPFFLDKTDSTPPFTEAIAMKYGWMWKIPVGNRYGCGYVFDSDLVSDEDVYEEICKVTKHKPHVPRKLNFKPEYATKPFNKNTLALGLSHGFLEPLEATSLMITIYMLDSMSKTIPGDIFNRNRREEYTEDYNKIVLSFVDNCVDMVFLHYLTPRDDTEFWRNFKKAIPERVSRTLDNINDFDIDKPNCLANKSPFTISNMIKCMGGVDYIKSETIQRNVNKDEYPEVERTIEKIKNVCEKSINHDQYLIDLTST